MSWRFDVLKRAILTVRKASNQVVGGSNPSGRTKIKDLDALFFSAVLLTNLNSTISSRKAGHCDSAECGAPPIYRTDLC